MPSPDTDGQRQAGRRHFLARLAGLLVGGALVPAVAGCGPDDGPLAPDQRRVDISLLVADGSGLISAVTGPDGTHVLVNRVGRDRFAAVSTLCTHEGCLIAAPVDGTITCPCHGSQYDLEGHVLRGPARYDLTRYPVVLEHDRHFVRITLDPS